MNFSSTVSHDYCLGIAHVCAERTIKRVALAALFCFKFVNVSQQHLINELGSTPDVTKQVTKHQS